MLMCLIVIVEDVSTAIFIKCGKIFVISLPSLKDIYVVLFFFFFFLLSDTCLMP